VERVDLNALCGGRAQTSALRSMRSTLHCIVTAKSRLPIPLQENSILMFVTSWKSTAHNWTPVKPCKVLHEFL
jgi:hypothetical protein